jgi:hypothetical protein
VLVILQKFFAATQDGEFPISASLFQREKSEIGRAGCRADVDSAESHSELSRLITML